MDKCYVVKSYFCEEEQIESIHKNKDNAHKYMVEFANKNYEEWDYHYSDKNYILSTDHEGISIYTIDLNE